jgi:hypothetical protein
MRTHLRTARSLIVAVAAVMLGSTVVAGPGPATAAEGGPGVVIQLGDSFASGEGGGWKGNPTSRYGDRGGTDMAAIRRPDGNWEYHPEWWVYQEASWANGCHVAKDAPVSYVGADVPGVQKVINLACSGATSRNLWPVANGGQNYHGLPPQLTQLSSLVSSSDDVKLVSIGIGGNDAGFGDAIGHCLLAWAKTNWGDGWFDNQYCDDDLRNGPYPDVIDVYYNHRKTIDLVRQTLAARGQPVGSYRIVFTGYPSILPTDQGDWNRGEGSLFFDGRCPVRKADAQWINNNYVRRLNNIAKVAAEDMGVGFIDLSDAFAEHRLCEAGTVRGWQAGQSSANAEWVRSVDVHPDGWELARDLLFTLADPPFTFLWVAHVDWKNDRTHPYRHINESFHPNFWGQQAIGTCLTRYAMNTTGNPRVKCTNGATRGATDMNLTTLPATATVVDDPNPNVTIPRPTGCCQPGDPGDPEPEPVPLLNPLVRTVSVPASVPAGQFFQPFLDLSHPKKGQLRIDVHAPNGAVYRLRDFNQQDQGAWTDGRWTYGFTGDPSGTWTLKIYDWGWGGVGYLNAWDLRFN